MKPTVIALVGAGAFGEFCLKAFDAMPEIRIRAVGDIDAERAKALAKQYQADAYTNLEALLREPSVEIVALNTPPYLHAEQGLAVLRAGKHLFCEKPLALTEADGEALIRAAAENQKLLTVDYVMRYNPFWQAAADLTHSNVLGELRNMDLANHAAGRSLPANHWFWDKAKSGGIWIEHGVHFFDAFAWVAGKQGEILASVSYDRADGATDRVEVLARFGMAAAHFYHGFDQSGQTEQTTVRLAFEQGYIILREWVPTTIEIVTSVAPETITPYLHGEIEITPYPNNRSLIRAYAPEGKSVVYQRCIQSAMLALVDAIRTGNDLPVTGHEGLMSLRMALAAESSSAT